jgi:serine protease Do
VRALGSGFIVTHEGLILTNAHVVDDAKTLTVTLSDHRQYQGRVLGADPSSDIAVVKSTPTICRRCVSAIPTAWRSATT